MSQKNSKEQKTLRLLGFGALRAQFLPARTWFLRSGDCRKKGRKRPKTLRLLVFGALEALASQRERDFRVLTLKLAYAKPFFFGDQFWKNPFTRGVWVVSEKTKKKKNSIIGIFFCFF